MEIIELYNNIEMKGKDKIKTFSEEIDKFIDDRNDNRMGITLTIRPTKDIKEKIECIEKEIKK